MTPHNEAKKGEISKNVLMPGDPLRAKYIADNFLTDVKLVNKVRNIYAYTGFYKGKEVTVMASGMGMPSIGIYSYELYKFYDVENIIRIGTAGSYSEDIKLYDVILVDESYSLSSYAKTQGYNHDTIKASEYLNSKIEETANKLNRKVIKGKIHSTDVFYGNDDIHKLHDEGCLCTEMESYSLFYNAEILNKNAACILTISDNLITHEASSPEERQLSLNNMITLALETVINL